MAKQYLSLSDHLADFIREQRIFFVATATDNSRINLSPKGLDSLRILNPNRLIWVNLTGSGNETAAHIQTNARMTLMFCAFSGDPLILRLYGTARSIHQRDPEWNDLFALFNPHPGARQIFDLSIELVQTSCGFGVPYFDFTGDRPDLDIWTHKKGTEGIKAYWYNRNQESIDGIKTDIREKNP